MELHADEPAMAGQLDDFRQLAIGRHAGEEEPRILELAPVVDVDLVAMAMALADLRRTIDRGHLAARLQHRLIGAEAHRAAEIAARLALLELVATHPFGHEADDGIAARTELGAARLLEPRQIARRLDHRHLHAEADAEIGHLALAGEARRCDLAFGTALAEAARHQDAVHAFKMMDR